MSEFDRSEAAREVGVCRAAYVDGVVLRWLDRLEGNATTEQILEREARAYRWWIDTYPTLNSLLGEHLPEHSTSSPAVSS